MFDYLIITHIPVFYKINLYNELNKKMSIFVVFISKDTEEKRSSDFIKLENATFNYEVLNSNDFQHRNKLLSLFRLANCIRRLSYKQILVSGWDLIEFWLAILITPKRKNCLALESTILESSVTGIKKITKQIFLSSISTTFASGQLHKELLDFLSYKGRIIITKGVGILNKVNFDNTYCEFNKNFIFIGRLTAVKNLETVIKVFNKLEQYTLNIVGSGSIESELKHIAKDNIFFKGSVDNKDLHDLFKQNSILILPSLREPWGLVVEEALYFGVPVIVSSKCGCSELVEEGVNGFIIDPNDEDSIRKVVTSINDDNYIKLLNGVQSSSINIKDEHQVDCYVKA